MDINVLRGIALILFFTIPVSMGSLSICLLNRHRQWLHDSAYGRDILSLLNCFAGGFFLGTSLIVVMADGKAKFEEYRLLLNQQSKLPVFEILIGIGFLLVVLVEKLILLLKNGKAENNNGKEETKETKDRDYSVQEGTAEAVRSEPGESLCEFPSDEYQTVVGETEAVSDGNTQKGKTDHAFHLRLLLLLVAMSFHTVFDGMTIGMQTEEHEVLTLLIVFSVHKAITSTILGMELSRACIDQKACRPFLALILYSLVSPLGMVISIGVISGHVEESAKLLSKSVMQAVAAGVFLNITCFEILLHELVAKDDKPLVRVAVVLMGFALIAAFSFVEF